MNYKFLIPLLFLLLLSGCTQTEEGKASFGILFIFLFIFAVIILSLFLNLFTIGILRWPIRTIVTVTLLILGILGFVIHPIVGILGIVIALVAFLILWKIKKEKPLEGAIRKFFSLVGLLIAVLSIIITILLVLLIIFNFLRCSGGCFNVFGDSVLAFFLSLIPGIIGFLHIKFRKVNKK